MIPMHCTGEGFIAVANQEMPDKLLRSSTGTRFHRHALPVRLIAGDGAGTVRRRTIAGSLGPAGPAPGHVQ
ncbi:MAG: hypothetical protein KJZ83_14650 [Burkholderiaceae bacterium]|nr:hypothetical protein [Burkholderiaceae bacterium]